MERVWTVDEVNLFSAPIGVGRVLVVAARGEVPTSGWTGIRLSPRIPIVPPSDGIWDFDFLADAPVGIVLELVSVVHAAATVMAPSWCKGVRVIAKNNNQTAALGSKESAVAPAHALERARQKDGNVIVSQSIAQYEDSWQPTGNTKIGWDGIHIEMKKLVHHLTLTVEGPNEQQIRKCIQSALAAGVLAAIIAAFSTGGMAAVSAGLAVAESALLSCLGQGYTVRFNDNSNWVTWWT